MYIHTKLAKCRQRDLLSAASRDCLAAQFRYPDTVTSDQTATCPARLAWRPVLGGARRARLLWANRQERTSPATEQRRDSQACLGAVLYTKALTRRSPDHHQIRPGQGIHGHVQRCGV